VQELVGDGAIHDAVVVAERDVAHRADGDGVVDHHRTLFDRAESQNADVGWLMTGRPNRPPKTPGLVMEKVPSCTSSGLSFLERARSGEIVEVALDAEEIFFVGVLDDRNDQAPVERDGHADIDLPVQGPYWCHQARR